MKYTVKLMVLSVMTLAGNFSSFQLRSAQATSIVANETAQSTNALPAGYYEETDSRLTYSSGWLSYAEVGNSGGTYSYADQTAATVSFTFSGTGFSYIRRIGTNRGLTDVCIDNVCQQVNNYSSVWLAQQAIKFNGYASGNHTVVIRQKTARLDLDALSVENVASTTAPTVAPTNTPQPTVVPVTLSAPNIVGPSNGEQIAYDAQPFVFNWDAVSGATNYRIQIATDSAFGQMVYDTTPISDGWAAQTKFNAGTYYWRVAAMAAGAQGPWTATLKVVILAPAPTPSAPQYRPIATQIPYTATSPWNTPIGANPVYDRYSSQMIADMGKGVTGGKIYSDTTQYTYPVYFADKNTPRYSVPCTQYKCTVVDANGTVTRVTSITLPIPNGAKQSAGTDAQLIVIDTDTGTEYGLYHAAKQADGSWTAGNGYIYSINYAGTQPGFGSRGAGVPYYAGLIRPWEIRSGEIKHAIAFVYQFTAATKCVFPAAQTDGTTTGGYPIPEGARIQLNPNLTEADFDRWGLTRAGKIVARAMQKYGMILIDTGGSPKIIAENLSANTLYGESWADADLNYTKNVIANIPYTELRVMKLPDSYYNGATPNYGKCVK